MKKMLYVIVFVCTLVLSGCSYDRDSEPGEVVSIRVDEMAEMIENKETFPILFTQTTCGHCIDFHAMLDTYLLNHNVVLYEVVLDEAPQSKREANLKTIRTTFKDFNETPSLYYVKDGKLEHQVSTETEIISKDRFDDWVQDYKLDEKK